MIGRSLAIAALVVAGGILSACATARPSLDQAQCLAADWSRQGYSDAASGRGSTRLEDHVEACAEHGVVPDAAAYRAGHHEGRRMWCVPANGFALGRRGSSYNQGYCPEDLEPGYMAAVADGREVHAARAQATAAEVRLIEAQGRIDSLSSQMRTEEANLAMEGLTEAQVSAIRYRIRNLRDERDTLQYDLGRLQSDADDARREADAVALRFVPIYG